MNRSACWRFHFPFLFLITQSYFPLPKSGSPHSSLHLVSHKTIISGVSPFNTSSTSNLFDINPSIFVYHSLVTSLQIPYLILSLSLSNKTARSPPLFDRLFLKRFPVTF